jgi:hypothetical protein
MSIQQKKSDGTWKLIVYGFFGSVSLMLLAEMLLRLGACK